MKPDVIAPPVISAAPEAAIAPTGAEHLAASCALCGQPLDPQPEARTLDSMPAVLTDDHLPVCWDCRVETTKRREPRC